MNESIENKVETTSQTENKEFYKSLTDKFEENFMFRCPREDWPVLRDRITTAKKESALERALRQGKIIRPDKRLKTSTKLYPQGIDIEKSESALDGLEIVSVNDPASRLLRDAYWFTSQHMPVNEIDTLEVYEASVRDMTCKSVKGINNEPQIQKFIVAAIVDKTGKYGKKGAVLATIDGTFQANSYTNVFYMSHIATRPDVRRLNLGTALENAVLALCESYAKRAEKQLNTKYQRTPIGTALQYMDIEVDFANLSSENDVKLSCGRHCFHGINGASVIDINRLRYSQSDTTWGEKPYSDSWEHVPMYLAVRPIGRENAETIPTKDAIALISLMYSGFILQEMCEQGVMSDHDYALSKIDNANSVNLHRLPTTPEEAEAFVREHGEASEILKTHYSGHNYTRHFADALTPTVPVEKIVSILRR